MFDLPRINNPRWSNHFFTLLLLSLWGLAVFVSGRPCRDVLCRGCLREGALLVPTTLSPCIALLILLDLSVLFSFATAPTMLFLPPPAVAGVCLPLAHDVERVWSTAWLRATPLQPFPCLPVLFFPQIPAS